MKNRSTPIATHGELGCGWLLVSKVAVVPGDTALAPGIMSGMLESPPTPLPSLVPLGGCCC